MEDKNAIRWKITDKWDSLHYISDHVIIDKYKFVFYAERDIQKYKGLKIFTCLLSSASNKITTGHSRNIAPMIEKYDTAPYKNNSFSQESAKQGWFSAVGDYNQKVWNDTVSSINTVSNLANNKFGNSKIHLTVFAQVNCLPME